MDEKIETIGKDFYPLKNLDQWDILIILDACRFKEFAELNQIPGKLKKRISFCTDTGEWADSAVGIDLKNVVYVSGNPIVRYEHFDNIHDKNPFLHIEPVWDYGWSDELKTTPPEPVSEAAVKINKKYPDKKMVVHYMQPHHPFIGEHRLVEDGYKSVIATAKGEVCDEPFQTIYNLLQTGVYTYEQGLIAYKDNLKLVLQSLKPVLDLPGRKIITADHGDTLGENGQYGHPRALYIPLLVEVPWFEIANK